MQVEHHTKDFPSPISEEHKFGHIGDLPKSEFGPLQDFDPVKIEEELEKTEVKEVHVFKRGGLAEINARLRHEEPNLTRRQRRKKAKLILKGKNA